MTTGGWIFMIGSLSSVTCLLVFCFWRVLRKPASTDHTHAPRDTDTDDAGT